LSSRVLYLLEVKPELWKNRSFAFILNSWKPALLKGVGVVVVVEERVCFCVYLFHFMVIWGIISLSAAKLKTSCCLC